MAEESGWRRGIFPVALAGAALALLWPGLPTGALAGGETVLLYALAVAVAARYGILLPGVGAVASAAGGLLLAALWLHGLSTALLALVSAYLLTWVTGRLPPAGWFCCLQAGAGLLGAAVGQAAAAAAWPGATGAAWALSALVYSVGSFAVALALPRPRACRPFPDTQGPPGRAWDPLVHLGTAALVAVAARAGGPPGELAVAAGLAGAQVGLRPLLNPLVQDREVRELLRRAGRRRTARPGHYERLLRHAGAIAGALRLSDGIRRALAYACVLQDIASEFPPSDDWLLSAEPPDHQALARLGAEAEESARLVARVGALAAVADILRHRHAWWDGRGVPAAAGEAIPPGARVLAVANGLALLTTPSAGAEGVARAREWLATQAGRRLAPEVAWAAAEKLGEGAPGDAGGALADTLRRLQAVRGSGAHLVPGPLSRLLRRLRRRMGDVADLPDEALAVAQLAQVLHNSAHPDEVAAAVLAAAAQLTGGAAFLALAGDAGHLVVQAARGLHRLDLVGRQLEPGWAALVGEGPAVWAAPPPAAGALARELARVEGIRAAIALPVAAGGRMVGLLFSGLPHTHWFGPRETGMLSLLAGQAALALENSRRLARAGERLEQVTAVTRLTDLIMDHLPAGVMTVDLQRRVTYINRAGMEMLRQAGTAQPVVGEPAPIHPVNPVGALDEAIRGEVVEVVWEPRPGLVLEIRALPLRDGEGRLVGAMALGWDITRLRQMEQEVRRVTRLADMGKLAAGAAHEIRNPLTAIRGFVQLLQARSPADSAEAGYIQVILEELDRIEGIVRDLLLLSRPADPVRAPVCLPDLLDEVIMLMGGDLGARGVTVRRAYGTGVPPAWGDARLLKQVAMNLVRNAAEALDLVPAGDGAPAVRDLTLRVGSAAGQVWFQVDDTGPGIRPEDMGRLFTPFFTTKEGGTGLGLAISYAIATAHGGTVEVRSRPREGACFTVWLPAAAPAGDQTGWMR